MEDTEVQRGHLQLSPPLSCTYTDILAFETSGASRLFDQTDVKIAFCIASACPSASSDNFTPPFVCLSHSEHPVGQQRKYNFYTQQRGLAVDQRHDSARQGITHREGKRNKENKREKDRERERERERCSPQAVSVLNLCSN